MPKRKKKTVPKKQKDGEVCDNEAESESAKKVAAASSTSQAGEDGEDIPSFTSVPLLMTSEEGVKGTKTSHFMCNYCEFSAESKGDLISHMRKHMIKCTKCQFSSLSRKEVTQHCKEEHDVDFEATAQEVATSSTEVEMDKDPCSACVFCKFMTYSTEHLERHTCLKHPGMLPKSVAKMVTKLASTQIRQGDVRFYLSLAGKDNIDDNKLVSSSPPTTVSSEPIEIEDEHPPDIKPKFEPLEQKVSTDLVKKLKREAHEMKSTVTSVSTSSSDTFTQQLAKRMKQESMSVRSEADTSERKADRGVKVETIYCLTCPYSNVLIDKLKCHTLVQHPLGAAVATYCASGSSLSDFTFFCVKEECPYSTGDLNEYQAHLMNCCSSIKSLKIIEKERFKSTVSFIFDLQKKHSLEEEKGFIEYAMSVLPHPHKAAKAASEVVPSDPSNSPSPLQPLQPHRSEITSSSEPREGSQTSAQQAKTRNPQVSDNNVHQQKQVVPEMNNPLTQNRMSDEIQFVHELQQLPQGVTSASEHNGMRSQSNVGTAPIPQYLSQRQHQNFTLTGQRGKSYNDVSSQNKAIDVDQIQSLQGGPTSLPNFLNAESISSASEVREGIQRESQAVTHNVGAVPYPAPEQLTQQFHKNNPAISQQQQIPRSIERNMQTPYQRNTPRSPMSPHTPVQGLRMPNVTPETQFRRGRGRPRKMSAHAQHSVPDDDVIVTAVVKMSPSSQRGRPPTSYRGRGRGPALSSQRFRAPAPNHGQVSNQPRGRGVAPVSNYGRGYSLPRGRGANLRPNFTPLPQHRPIDMRSHFEALACAANPDEEDDLKIVGMTPGKDGSFGNPKAVDASRFSFCCLHCGKDQGSKNVMKQHMKACHNDTLLGAFTNIDTGQWLYFCPQLNCAFMTYDEQRLRDHLQKCCDPEKWKAFDFGVAMNNLKSMKIRQLEVRNMSGSQNDPVDLDGQGMRDRFSTSLNDAFDDILVNTTGRQMVRPVGGRRSRALSNQGVQPQRMHHPYQAVNAPVRGRGLMPRPRQSMEPMMGTCSPRARLPTPRQPGVNYNTGFPRPMGRRPGMLPPHAARGTIPMQRPRMPHPVTRTPERPQPTTLQNPILIDVDPDSPEQPRSDPSDAAGYASSTGLPAPRLGNSVHSQGQTYSGDSQGLQSRLPTRPAGYGKELMSENQNPDQSSSNFLSVPPSQVRDSNQLSIPTTTSAPEESVTAHEISMSSQDNLLQGSHAPSTEQQAGWLMSQSNNEPLSTNFSECGNLPAMLSSTSSVTTLSSSTDQTTIAQMSSSVSDTVATSQAEISVENEALNTESIVQGLLENTGYHENVKDTSLEINTTDTLKEKQDTPEAHPLKPQNSDLSKASGEGISHTEVDDLQALPILNENLDKQVESLNDTPPSLPPDIFSSYTLPYTDMQYSAASINSSSAVLGDAVPPQSTDEQNRTLTRQQSSPETQSLGSSASMQAESVTDEQLLESSACKDSESTADKYSRSSEKSVSVLESQAVSSTESNLLLETPGNNQLEHSSETYNSSPSDDQPSYSAPLAEQYSYSNESHTLASKSMQSALSTDMLSTTSPSQLQPDFSSDTQSTSVTDYQSAKPASEMLSATSFYQSLAPSTHMSSSEHFREKQLDPSTNNTKEMQTMETDIQPEFFSNEKQSKQSANVQSVIPALDMQSAPFTGSLSSTDMQVEPLSNEQQLQPNESHMIASPNEMKSKSSPSTPDQPLPCNSFQSPPGSVTSAHTTNSNNEHVLPPNNMLAVSTVIPQHQSSSIMEQTPSANFYPGNDTHNIPPAITQALYPHGMQPPPSECSPTQSASSSSSETLLSTCSSQPLPTTHQQNAAQASTTPVPAPAENKTVNGQGNQWSSSEVFDEEERINAVVLEKVFAKVPNMPKTLSRRLVFKFKQYANYKNVKITPDSKVIDEFVSKISYKGSGSADQKNSKSAQAAGNTASASMSTRSGKNFSESPSNCEKTLQGSTISSQDMASLKNSESQNLKPTLLNQPEASQIQGHASNLQEDENGSAIDQPSGQSNQTHVLAHSGENENGNRKPQSVSDERASEAPLSTKYNQTPSQTMHEDISNISQNGPSEEDSAMQQSFVQPPTIHPSSAVSTKNTAKEIPSHLQGGFIESENGNNLQHLVENRTSSPPHTNECLVSKEVSVGNIEAVTKTSGENEDAHRQNTSTFKISNSNDTAERFSSQNHSNKSLKKHNDTEEVMKSNMSPEKEGLEAGLNQSQVSQEDENNCEKDVTPSSQVAEHDEFSQEKACENLSASNPLQKDNQVFSSSGEDVYTSTSVQGKGKNILEGKEESQQQASNEPATKERANHVEEEEDTTDIVETQVILPERSIQFSGVFAKAFQGLKQTPKPGVSSIPGGVNEELQGENGSKDISPQHVGNPEITQTASQNSSQAQDSDGSSKLKTSKLKQVLKRTLQANGNEGLVHKKLKSSERRASAPAIETPIEATFVRDPSPESNSCPGKPSVSKVSKEDISPELKKNQSFNNWAKEVAQANSQCDNDSNMATVNLDLQSDGQSCGAIEDVQADSQCGADNKIATVNQDLPRDGQSCGTHKDSQVNSQCGADNNVATVNQDLPSDGQSCGTHKDSQVNSCDTDSNTTTVNQDLQNDDTCRTSNEEIPTIASLIAANLAAEREHKSSTLNFQHKYESFLNEPSSSKLESLEKNTLVQKPSEPTTDNDNWFQNLPTVSKEIIEKPDMVDKKTGRLILKVKKNNIPRFKASKSPPIENSSDAIQSSEDNIKDDHFVRRSLRERKVVHRDENEEELTEMDELMSEDDDEYHIEGDSDAYSSDSMQSWEDDSDHSQPKRMKKVKSPPDPTAFDFKAKGKYKCWLCRKIFSKCGFVKRHILKAHPDKGLCAVDLGQSDFLGSPQLLLFCPRKCRYATLSLEGMKEHMGNCEKDILNPLEVARSFVDTDYDELLKLGEKVLEIPEKKTRTSKKGQTKKSQSSEEKVEEEREMEDFHRKDSSESAPVLTQAVSTEPLDKTSRPSQAETVSKADQYVEPSQETSTPPTSELYDVVDVDLDFPEPELSAREPVQLLSSQPYSQFQQPRAQMLQNSQQQQQHFYVSHGQQANNPARLPQNFNTGHSTAQPRHPAMTNPRQITGHQVNKPSMPGPGPNRASSVTHHLPSRHPPPRQANANAQPRDFQYSANIQQQQFQARQRATLNPQTTNPPMQRPLQQVPRFLQGSPVRGARIANPRPRQAFVRPPQQPTQQQQRPRQPSFATQRYSSPRQPVGSQFRPRMMVSPNLRGRTSAGSNQQHWGGRGRQVVTPQHQYPAGGAVTSRNPGPNNEQGDSYTITESGVICLD